MLNWGLVLKKFPTLVCNVSVCSKEVEIDNASSINNCLPWPSPNGPAGLGQRLGQQVAMLWILGIKTAVLKLYSSYIYI